jgi:hypothetical protein
MWMHWFIKLSTKQSPTPSSPFHQQSVPLLTSLLELVCNSTWMFPQNSINREERLIVLRTLQLLNCLCVLVIAIYLEETDANHRKTHSWKAGILWSRFVGHCTWSLIFYTTDRKTFHWELLTQKETKSIEGQRSIKQLNSVYFQRDVYNFSCF